MRVLMLSKALVHGAYQRKCEELAALPGVTLTVAVPHAWREPRVGTQQLERRHTDGYRLEALPIHFNGRHHMHYYPTLGRLVQQLRPQVFHIDEEAFNPATFLALRAGLRVGARCCFFNWANIDRYYPLPFNLFERYVFRHAAHAIAGNREAATLMRRHGYPGPLSTLPRCGVDPRLYAPGPPRPADGRFIVGYLGRLVPEKGVIDLVEALALLPAHVIVRIIGDGIERPRILERAAALGVAARLDLQPLVSSSQVAAQLQQIDVLALPSRTWPNWKEQFGRILIEAMSCGVAVIGSSSGEIPHVVADAGLIIAEGDVAGYAAAIRRLADDAGLRRDLAQRGRARVLDHYTQAALARSYHEVYRQCLAQ